MRMSANYHTTWLYDIRLPQYQISYYGINNMPTEIIVNYLLTCHEERYAIWYYDKKELYFRFNIV